MPSEFHNREPPLPFGNPKSRPWYGMDIFWNRPFEECVPLASVSYNSKELFLSRKRGIYISAKNHLFLA